MGSVCGKKSSIPSPEKLKEDSSKNTLMNDGKSTPRPAFESTNSTSKGGVMTPTVSTTTAATNYNNPHQPLTPMPIPNDFNDDEIVKPLHSNGCNIDICAAINRFKYILSQHDEDMMQYGAYEFIHNRLNKNKKYNNIRLLDDYHHLMFVHEHEFEEIYNILGCCDLDKCTSYTRNHRDRSAANNRCPYNEFIEKTNNKNNKDLITKELNTIQIIDAMHCYFLHTFDCLYKLNRSETTKLNANIQTMYLQEMEQNAAHNTDSPLPADDDDDSCEEGPEIQIATSWRLRGMSDIMRNQQQEEVKKQDSTRRQARFARVDKKKYSVLGRALQKDKSYGIIPTFGSRALLDEIPEDDDEKKKNTKTGNDNNEELSVSESDDDENDGDLIHNTQNDIVYSFGVRFIYDKNKKNEAWYVKPKWMKLKDELIENKWEGFNKEHWDELYEKAVEYGETKRIREECKFIDTGDVACITKKQTKSLSDEEAMSICHLIAIMIYCNFDKLQANFSASFRKLENESNTDLKIKHSEWHQLGKYLREVVEIYGKRISSEENRLRRSRTGSNPFLDKSGKLKFFHGINKEMVFVSTSAKICGPLSTSSEPFVALQFAGSDGLLLELSGNNARFFDCCGISDYSNEKEKFFLGGYDPLLIETVINPRTKDYRPYVKAINIISCLFNGQQYHGRSGKPFGKKLKKRVYSLLLRQSKNKNKDNNNDDIKTEKLEEYVLKLFDHYTKNVMQITIDWKLMNLNEDDFNPSIKGFFFAKPVICMKTFNWIKMNRIMAMFENLEIIQLNYIKLKKEVMDYILHSLETRGDSFDYHDLKKIIIHQPSQDHGLTINDALAIYGDIFRDKVGWTLPAEETNNLNDLIINKVITP